MGEEGCPREAGLPVKGWLVFWESLTAQERVLISKQVAGRNSRITEPKVRNENIFF
jgi:hypothetical protein